MQCPKCGKQNPEDAQVCASCSCTLICTSARGQTRWVYPVYVSVLIFVLAAPGLWYGWSVKCERVPSPTDPDVDAVLYYRGLGLTNGHTWYGKYKVKLLDRGYASRNVGPKDFHSRSADIVMEISYYPNGAIESESPTKGDALADGIHKLYSPNGKLCEEIGIRVDPNPPCICCTHLTHGIDREYDESGRLELEKWFINGTECTRSQWTEWLKKRPEHVRYGSVGRP